MEKESGIPKPGELFIGVIDLFAVLVPGVIAAALACEVMGQHLEHASTVLVASLITAGWVLGHVLHGIGSWLDPLVYDRLFKPPESITPHPIANPGKLHDSVDPGVPPKAQVRKQSRFRQYFHKNDRLYRLATEMTDYPDEPKQPGQTVAVGVPGGMYQWARAWLNSHSPESTSNLNRHEADSKLFRSLTVLFLIAIPAIIGRLLLFAPPVAVILASDGHATMATPEWWQVMTDHRSALIIFACAGILFSLWRYCDLRNKMIRQCYLNYVQLRFESRR
jgi:hypothetical protein